LPKASKTTTRRSPLSSEEGTINRAQFVISTAGFVASTGAVSFAQTAGGTRSLWVWRTALSESAGVVAFAHRNSIRTVFLSILADDRDALEAGDATPLLALRAFGSAGLALYCVAGDPSWVERTRVDPPETVKKLLAVHATRGIFEGLALDVEPHTLPEWKDDGRKAALAQNYLALMSLIQSAAGVLNVAVLATVHPTYAKYTPPSGSGETLLQSVARIVDATDLMAYRNSEATLESFGGAAMEQLAGIGKPWWLGVSTHTGSPPGTSYGSLPAARFFPAIDKTGADLAQRYPGSFQGISIEDYRNTVALVG
jgi:hypothetical protein